MWRYRLTALRLELRRALQAEGFTEGHIAAQLTEPQWLDRVGTAIARRPTPTTGYLTEQATPHRTDRFSTEYARRVGLGHLRRTRRAMQMAKSRATRGGGRKAPCPLI